MAITRQKMAYAWRHHWASTFGGQKSIENLVLKTALYNISSASYFDLWSFFSNFFSANSHFVHLAETREFSNIYLLSAQNRVKWRHKIRPIAKKSTDFDLIFARDDAKLIGDQVFRYNNKWRSYSRKPRGGVTDPTPPGGGGLSLYINRLVSQRAIRSFFFREDLAESGRNGTGIVIPLMCRGSMRNGLCRRGLLLNRSPENTFLPKNLNFSATNIVFFYAIASRSAHFF